MLKKPLRFERSVWEPIAMLSSPVVFERSGCQPIAVFSMPVVFEGVRAPAAVGPGVELAPGEAGGFLGQVALVAAMLVAAPAPSIRVATRAKATATGLVRCPPRRGKRRLREGEAGWSGRKRR